MIKGSIQEEDRTIVNIYAPNIGAPQYIRQMLTAIKGETDSNTVTVGEFNTPLSPMDRSYKMKINKERQALNDTLKKMDLIDIYRTFHPKMCILLFLGGMSYKYQLSPYCLICHLKVVFPYLFSFWTICPLVKVGC